MPEVTQRTISLIHTIPTPSTRYIVPGTFVTVPGKNPKVRRSRPTYQGWHFYALWCQAPNALLVPGTESDVVVPASEPESRT